MALYIDNKEFNVEDITIQNIQIFSNVIQLLPTATIVLFDPSNKFANEITLADGMEVGIVIGPDENSFYYYSFRIFSFEQNPAGGTTTYKIDCYWDAPRYLSDIATRYYEGTSVSVLGEIAGECGLSFGTNGSTNDNMIWIPRNKKFGHFAKEVALHGYAGGNSIMCTGVDLNGKFQYIDLTKLPQGGLNFVRGGGEEGGVTVYTAESINKAGFFNHHTAYNHEVVEQTIMKPKYWEKYTNVNVKKISNYLMLNKTVKGQIDKGRREFTPFNTGNVHDHYQEAFYQNNRGMSNYNLGQYLIVKDHTESQLFEPVTYKINRETNTSDEQQMADDNDSGNYIVAGRNIQVLGGLQYSEKLTILRTGFNDDPSGSGTQL